MFFFLCPLSAILQTRLLTIYIIDQMKQIAYLSMFFLPPTFVTVKAYFFQVTAIGVLTLFIDIVLGCIRDERQGNCS